MRTHHQRRVESLVFFLDRSLGRYIVAEALRHAGVIVEIHDEHFPQAATDVEWLREVGRRGWIVLTRDTRIRYRSLERMALMQARVRAFVLVAGNLSGPEMAIAFVTALPAIQRFVVRYQPPFIARVTRSDTVALLQDTKS